MRSDISLAEYMARNGIRPVKIDKDGPAYKKSDVLMYVEKQIKAGMYYNQRDRKMSEEIKDVVTETDRAINKFEQAFDRFGEIEDRLSKRTKTATGRVRDAAQKLTDGLGKIERTANFDRLERYVALLERAEAAMSALAEMERSGKLERISAALK